MSRDRDELVDEVLAGGRTLSTAAVMFHSALAERVGLSATENKALELLDRHGPMTPAQLAKEAGLAPASVTALLDRLDRKQAARRVPHPKDGRRFLVEIDPDHRARSGALFADFVAGLHEMLGSYDDDELAVLARFLADATGVQQAATARLTGD